MRAGAQERAAEATDRRFGHAERGGGVPTPGSDAPGRMFSPAAAGLSSAIGPAGGRRCGPRRACPRSWVRLRPFVSPLGLVGRQDRSSERELGQGRDQWHQTEVWVMGRFIRPGPGWDSDPRLPRRRRRRPRGHHRRSGLTSATPARATPDLATRADSGSTNAPQQRVPAEAREHYRRPGKGISTDQVCCTQAASFSENR
jgi:hypothetical protein